MLSTPEPNDTASGPTGPTRQWLAIVLGCLVVFVFSSWPTLTQPLLYSNDGPQHLLQGFVHAHYDDPRFGFSDVFELNEPLTSRGYLDLFRWLEPVLGWYSAHRVILLFGQALWCSAWAVMALRLHRDRWPFALLGCATGIQWAYWTGLLPFMLSLGATLWAIHLVLLKPAARHYVALGALLVICCQLHPLPVVIAGIPLLLLAATRSRVDVTCTVFSGSPSFFFALYVSRHSAHQKQSFVWDNPIDPVRALVGTFFCGYGIWAALFLALALLAAAILWKARAKESRALGVVGGLLVTASYLSPNQLRGWEMFSPRLLPLGFALLFCAAPLELVSRRTRSVVAVLVVIVVGGHRVWADDFHEGLDRDSAPIVSLARQLPPQTGLTWGMLVTCGDAEGLAGLDRESTGPANLNAWLHLAQVVAVDLGGRPLFSQTSDLLMHAVLAPSLPHLASAIPGGSWAQAWASLDEAQRRQNIVSILDGIRISTPHLVFVGFSGDEKLVEEAGFEIMARVSDGPRTAVAARFRGCDVSIVVPPDTGLVESGPLPGNFTDVIRVPDVEGLVEFRSSGCGNRWIRVDGTPCGGSESDPYRRVRARFTDGAVLVCATRQ
jgi:hypothetical protein